VMATTQASSAAEGRRGTPGVAGCRKFLTVKPRSDDLEPERDKVIAQALSKLAGGTVTPITRARTRTSRQQAGG